MKRKNIYIDGLPLVEGHFSGIGQYTLGILRGIDNLFTEEKFAGHTTPIVTVIITKDTVGKFHKFGFKNIGYKALPISFRIMSALWRRRWLPPMDLFIGRGVYIFPRFVSMPLAFSKSAVVIYDLTFEKHRQYAEERNAMFLSIQVQKTLRKTSRVITISDHSRKEIIEFYGLKPQDVAVATPATDPKIFYKRSQKEIKYIKHKYGVKGEYILALSNLEPRKNLDGLVKAYCMLPKELRQKYSLLLVGVDGWKTDELFQKIVERVLDGFSIIRPSHYVSDSDKPAIISGAKLLVYPSHYEGFGMPPLEALACGVPVITADNSSLPEVVGTAGTMFHSEDTQKLKDIMVEKLVDIDNEVAKIMSKGPERAREFSWEASAQVFLDTAQELY